MPRSPGHLPEGLGYREATAYCLLRACPLPTPSLSNPTPQATIDSIESGPASDACPSHHARLRPATEGTETNHETDNAPRFLAERFVGTATPRGFPSPSLRAGGVMAADDESRPASGKPETARPVDFNREVRPILAKNCFACHGQDEAKRAKGLRLDRPRVGHQAAQERRRRRSSPATPNPAS